MSARATITDQPFFEIGGWLGATALWAILFVPDTSSATALAA
jgi:hypothetical protein